MIGSSFEVVSTIDQLAKLRIVDLNDQRTVHVLGYHEPNDGGGGIFSWNPSSTTVPIAGMAIAPRGERVGRWIRTVEGVVNDRMFGAWIDGVNFDDKALNALTTYLGTHPGVRQIHFLPGTRRVLSSGGPSTTCFQAERLDNLEIDWGGCVFVTDRPGADVSSTVFRFVDCRRLKCMGQVSFIGPLTSAEIERSTTARGSAAVVLSGNCSDSTLDIKAQGMLEALLVERPAARVMIDHDERPIVANGGAGYKLHDTLRLDDIGAPAIEGALLRVDEIDNGRVVAVSVLRAGLFPTFFEGSLPPDREGFAVSGGDGVGCQVLPFTLDYDDARTHDMTRRSRFHVDARECFYGYNARWNGSDCQVHVDSDFVFRAFFVFGVTGTSIDATIRNQHLNSLIATAMGTPTDVDANITVLPAATGSGFGRNGTAVTLAFNGAVSGRLKARIVFSARRNLGDDCGQYLKIEKYASGRDDRRPRGHRLTLEIAGKIDGHGQNDSGLGANIVGTNINYPDNSWNGDRFDIRLADGLSVSNCERWNFVFNDQAIHFLSIGAVNMDCAIDLVSNGAGGGIPKIVNRKDKRISVDLRARFPNVQAFTA